MARELYFLVESISTATEWNTNFHGETHAYIHGKEDFKLFGTSPDGWGDCNMLTPHFVREYGYKRKCDAERNWHYKHPENDKYWKTDVRIITAWVRKDGNVWLTV